MEKVDFNFVNYGKCIADYNREKPKCCVCYPLSIVSTNKLYNSMLHTIPWVKVRTDELWVVINTGGFLL